MTEDVERIVSAAVKVGDLIFSVPAPGRHHNVVQLMNYAGIKQDAGKHVQGFLTSEGRFVDRWQGRRVAMRAEQITDVKWPPNLYSEDLW